MTDENNIQTLPIQPNQSPQPSRREFKKLRREEAVGRKKTRRILGAAAALLGIGLLIWGGIFYTGRKAENLPGEFMEDQGRQHVTSLDHPLYNSNPPTSGWHFPQPAEWGIYAEEIPDEVLIHNLEHGGIWISYRPDVPEETIAQLKDLWRRKVIIAPRAANDTDIALSAWNHLEKFNLGELSTDRVEKFIRAYINKGPEFVP